LALLLDETMAYAAECFLSHSRNTASTRVCQPSPLSRKRALTAANRSSNQIKEGSGHLSQEFVFFIFPSIPGQFSIPVNFVHNPILAELALKASHQKILKMKPPDDP
jgi:hypothetical protein